MPRASEELTHDRKDEIMRACARLYETRAFRDITIKDIGAATSFTRTSIYNYFQTKEEIFLALLQQEYERWSADLDGITESNNTLDADALAHTLAHTLERRALMLKLMSMNLYDIEDNSSLQRLVEFKQAFKSSLQAVGRLLYKFQPQMSEKQRQEFVYIFFPFVYGVYPYTSRSEKQSQAMEQAGVELRQSSVYELTYTCVRNLLASYQ